MHSVLPASHSMHAWRQKAAPHLGGRCGIASGQRILKGTKIPVCNVQNVVDDNGFRDAVPAAALLQAPAVKGG